MRQVVVVIPARYGSTRLPGKPLVTLAGKPMIQHVYERAKQAQTVHRVVVATDDARIVDAVRGFGGEAVMTRTDHRTGTERVAEVAAEIKAGNFDPRPGFHCNWCAYRNLCPATEERLYQIQTQAAGVS